jgi:WD40 repeat protein
VARVFVSHAGADLGLAEEVCNWLRGCGHEPFLDRDRHGGIIGGELWKQRLYRELRRADAVVCIVTSAFVASDWCKGEVWIADALQCRLLPLRAEAKIGYPFLETVQYIDYAADPGCARDQLIRALVEAKDRTHWREGVNPFPGLAPFTAALSSLFFGRSREGRELAGQLRTVVDGGLVAVVGPSGCGKSSLMAAELLPRLDNESGWLTILPWVPGDDPLYALTNALVFTAQQLGLDWSALIVRDRLDQEGGLRRLADDLLRARPDARRLLIAIDQAEEMFTQTTDPERRDRLATLLREAVAGPVRVVLTLRSVFLDDLRNLPALAGVPFDTYVLGPLDRDRLRLAIEQPAQIAGLRIEPELVARLVADTGSGEALPLLAFTLQQLAEGLSRGGTLSADRYDSLGGVHGALAKRADMAHATAITRSGLSGPEILAGLVRLAAVDETGRHTRRRVNYADLPAPLQIAADVFVDHRLLTATNDEHGTWIAVAHEALLTAWPPLNTMISEQTLALHTARSVEQAAAEWASADRAEHFLWNAQRLSAALTNLPADDAPAILDHDARLFLVASRDRVVAAEQQERSRHKRTISSLSLLLAGALVAAGIAIFQSMNANDQRDTATARGLIAQAEAARRTSPRLAVQLGIAAHQIHPSAETSGSLINTLTTSNYKHTLIGPSGVAVNVAFSRDGRRLVAATGIGIDTDRDTDRDSNAVILWDTTDSVRPRRLSPSPHAQPGQQLRAAAFNSGGTMAATGDLDGTVTLWDTTNPADPRKLGQPFNAHKDSVKLGQPFKDPFKDSVERMALSPDGRVLATASSDETAILWDVADPSHPRRLRLIPTGPSGEVFAVVFSPDGRILVTANRDNSAILWDITDPAQPRELSRLTGHTEPVFALAFSPDGHMLATAGADKTVVLWDITDLVRPRQVSPPTIADGKALYAVAFSPDGRTLATGGAGNTVSLWDITDPATPRPLGLPLAGHTDVVSHVAFSPDGRALVTTSWGGAVVLWETTGPIQPLDGHTGPVNSVSFSPDGHTLASGGSDNRLTLWNVADPTRPRTISQLTTGSEVRSVAFSPDRRTMATTNQNNTVSLWDVTTPDHPRRAGQPFTGHAISVLGMAFSPDGRILATSGTDNIGSQVGNHSVILWDITDAAHPHRLGPPLKDHPDSATSIAFSPNGHTLAGINADGSGGVILWDVTNPAEPHRLGRPMKAYSGLASSEAFRPPDGHILVTGGWNAAVILWDVTDPANAHEASRALTGYINAGSTEYRPNFVESVVFSADGKTMATASEDKTVTLWDTTNPAQPRTLGPPLAGHTGPVLSVVFSPDGHMLATGGEDKTVILWDLAKLKDIRDHTIERACERAGGGLTTAEWSRYVGADYKYQETCPRTG